MQREIKFRTYDKRSGAIEYVSLKDLADGATFDITYEHYDWMQFTGLLDKNSKEIYEGDVVLYRTSNGDKLYTKVVEWKHSHSYNGWNVASSKHLEIVGDIYRNPKLITSKQ